jgi:hypothetical protein
LAYHDGLTATWYQTLVTVEPPAHLNSRARGVNRALNTGLLWILSQAGFFLRFGDTALFKIGGGGQGDFKRVCTAVSSFLCKRHALFAF